MLYTQSNDAREVLIEWFYNPELEVSEQFADKLLAYLLTEGYKIVPLTKEDTDRAQKDTENALHKSNA